MAETPACSVNAQAQACVPRTAAISFRQFLLIFWPIETSNLRSGRLSSISAFRVGRRVQRDAGAWESQGRRIGLSSNTLKWRSDVADGEALERDGRLLRQSVRLLGRQLLGLV